MANTCANGHLKGSRLDCRWCVQSNRLKERWVSNRDVYMRSIDKITAGFRSEIAKVKRQQYFSSDKHKKLASQQALKLAKDRRSGIKPPIRSKICDTKPELAFEQVLSELEIKYQKQCPIGPYSFDFFLPDFNLLVEVQGEYWHNLPNNIRNDLSKSEYVRRYHTNLNVKYVEEIDTKKRHCLRKLLLEWTGKDIPVVSFEFKNLIIKEVDPKEAVSFMGKFHYLPRFRKTTRATHGIYLSNKLIAVAIYGLPSYNTLAKKHGLVGRQVLELTRFVIDPKFQKKNLASWALSKSIKLIKSTKKSVCLLVSFADPHFGHNGTIYKAANWDFDGQTKPSYYYQDQEENILHKKTLWDHAQKIGKSETEYALLHNYTKIDSEPKQKFIKWLKKPQNIIVTTNVTDLVDTICFDCSDQACIKKKAVLRSINKNGGYICHSCAMRRWHKTKKEAIKI